MKNKVKPLAVALFLFMFNFIWLSCSEMAKDSEIKADIASKAKQDIDFQGVKYTVADRVVTLSGNCPTDKAKSKVEGKVKGIAGVRNVVNNIAIAPVIIGSDQPLKQAVDSVLKKYPQAQADISDSMILLNGQVERKEHEELVTALHQLQPKNIQDKLIIK